MGGTNETKMAGLRIHHNNGEVHVHDDRRKQKFSMDERAFSGEITKALKDLKQTDAVSVIEGKGADLVIGKNNQGYFMALAGNVTASEINDLIKGL
jgi:hypothetical protein